MKIANLFEDRNVLTEAQKCAEEILISDMALENSENLGIKQKVDELTNKASVLN